jgi:single-stranded DNA-specific DHH superfamily exonuclease
MKLSPFGSGNAYPIFSCKKMKVVEIQTLTNGKHLKMKLSNGDKQWILAKAWRKGYLADRISIGDFIDVAFNLEIDTWMNRNNLSLNIIDIQIK